MSDRPRLALLLLASACGPQATPAWSWDDGEVLATPLVGDLDGDGTPEVVAVIGRISAPDRFDDGAVVVLGGATGVELWRRDAAGRVTPVIGDVDGDARPDLVHAGLPRADGSSTLHAVDAAGAPLWTSRTADGQPAAVRAGKGALVLANLDDDPGAELAIGGSVFDNDGLLVWQAPNGGAELGSPHLQGDPDSLLYPGGLATFVDLTGDGDPELLTGRHAWRITWTPGAPPVVVVEMLWQDDAGLAGDGYPGVADLDGNGTPEVVLVAWPEIHVLDGATGELWCGVDTTGALCDGNDDLRTAPIRVPDANLGGPPTIADFDGDARPEVAISSGGRLTVYDFYRPGEDLAYPNGDAPPAPGALFRRWSAPIQDASSGSNGVAAFDFDGDGAVDLAHQDECHVRLLDGPTGEVRRQIPNTSATIHEYPVIADIDGDGSTELLAAANLSEKSSLENCALVAGTAEFTANKGLTVVRDDAWPPARPHWTSHTYHLSDVDDRGNAPARETPAWRGRNSFRETAAP